MNPSQPETLSALRKRTTQVPVQLLARTAVEAILQKKGFDIRVLDMRKVSGVADFFVVASGAADLQVRALADAVREEVRNEHGELPWHTEGIEHLQWVVLDYVDLVVHVFLPEKRAFYNLERLWGDAPVEDVDVDGTAADVKMLDTPPQA